MVIASMLLWWLSAAILPLLFWDQIISIAMKELCLKVQGQPPLSQSVMPRPLSPEHSLGLSCGRVNWWVLWFYMLYPLQLSSSLSLLIPNFTPRPHSSSDISISYIMAHCFLQALINHPHNLLALSGSLPVKSCVPREWPHIDNLFLIQC